MTDPGDPENGLPEDEIAFRRLWGEWDPVTPAGVAALLGDFAGPWWIAGGYAIEAFTGRRRRHDDIDVAIFARDLPALVAAVEGRLHVWSVGDRAMRPLDPDHLETVPEASQVWLREHAAAPWRADVLLNPDRDGRWVNRRDESHTAPLAEVTWVGDDGVRYLRPEVALLFKARLARPKDDADLAAAWPRLDGVRRAWLRPAVARTEPGHPWLTSGPLAGAGSAGVRDADAPPGAP